MWVLIESSCGFVNHSTMRAVGAEHIEPWCAARIVERMPLVVLVHSENTKTLIRNFKNPRLPVCGLDLDVSR
jgi:hypothetical protein